MPRGIKLLIGRNLFHSNVRGVINSIRCFYDARTKNDTIFAPANPIASGKGSPLGVIRVSGPLTNHLITTFTRLTTAPDQRIPSTKTIEPRKATLTKIHVPNNPSDVIDIGLIIWFPKPNSYTGEDVCEFHLHGSQAIMKHVLGQLGKLDGVRPAEPGEFTRRAVKNNKMSLIQAESLPDLIASKTDKQRKLALKGLEGSVVKKYELWLGELVNILAHLEASIDFGEDELIGEARVVDECIAKLGNLSRNLSSYIRHQTQSSNYIRNGFRVAIMGRPNVGKSSLMNKLCRSERSIVSDICGTTRDVVEQSFELGGHSLSLCDTAGLRDTSDDIAMSISQTDIIKVPVVEGHRSIEQEGIKRALIEGSKADVIMYVIDVTQLNEPGREIYQLSDEIIGLVKKLEIEQKLTQQYKARRKLLQLIMNKIDIDYATEDKSVNLFGHLVSLVKNGIQSEQISHKYTTIAAAVSCKTGQNLESLVKRLSHQLDVLVSSDDSSFSGEVNCNFETMEFVNERHLAFLESCQRNIFEASQLNLARIDQMAQHVRDATDYLSRCLGTVSNEQVLDVIFRDFCIGK